MGLLEEKPLSISKLEKMQQLYQLDNVQNSEIKFRWIRLGLMAHFEPAVPKAIEMVTEQGRMKFLRPLYRDLYEWEAKRQEAIEVFLRLKDQYMQVAAYGRPYAATCMYWSFNLKKTSMASCLLASHSYKSRYNGLKNFMRPCSVTISMALGTAGSKCAISPSRIQRNLISPH